MDEPFNMRKMGLEPTRCNHHKILSLARLPIPTLPQAIDIISIYRRIVKKKMELFTPQFSSLSYYTYLRILTLRFIYVILTKMKYAREAYGKI